MAEVFMSVIHYLQMNSIEELKGRELSDPEFKVEFNQIKQYKLNKFLYDLIGEPFLWFDKREWTDEMWREYVVQEGLYTWVAYKKGAIAGYFELFKEDNSVEIKYFGLSMEFINTGLGSGFLTYAIKRAWELGADRVILNTCDKDHPKALQNYIDRGFKKIREEKK